ncbi:ATP-binding protein [Methylocapsa acidiphila]|uniref:ATP-binding protein n=1 Tax=Methylocapsa acidiphila TaxID=133552 RepID=UPI0006848CBA|nr:ATP-binding protein [Methylocapsa acidiphila]
MDGDAVGASPKRPGLRISRDSIAKRLFFSATVLSFVILLVSGLALTTIYKRGAEDNFDERLGVYLRALVAEIATPGEAVRLDPDELSDPQFELALSGWYWQITRLDSEKPLIRGSRSLFAAKLPRLSEQGVEAGLGGARRGYVKGPDDRPLRMLERVIDAGDDGIFLVQVAATTKDLDAQIARFELDLVVAFSLLALALIGSSIIQLRYGLRPLRRLRRAVVAIRRGQREMIEGDFPRDIAPLAGELNLLIAANREVVERARTQVGNLAHALKTPLSVIMNEAAVDQGTLASKVEEQALIMRDQVSYYLDRARAAVRAGTLTGATEVAPVVEALLRTFEKIYAARAIVFSATTERSIRFLGERQDLEEMIGNLVDNAGKWAAREITISVVAEPVTDVAGRTFFRVTIDDDGPGLAKEQREAALRRGSRLDETKPGSGLGLSIVVDLASMYGGALELGSNPTGGLRAELRLPLAEAAAERS